MAKDQIHEGYTFGQFTVMEKTDKKKNGYPIWKCKCSCGKEQWMDQRLILRETRLDCGCKTPVRSKQKDIRNKKFGNLTALEPTETRKDGSTIWKCRCECGEIHYYSLRELQRKKKFPCACQKDPAHTRLLNQRFGRLVVVEYEGKKKGVHYWKCQCDCGNTAVVSQSLLLGGKTKSCGCLQKESVKQRLQLTGGTSVTRLETSKNHLSRSNTSGYTGVYRNHTNQTWIAQITFQKKTHYLGSFENLEDAIQARKKGEELHRQFLEEYYAKQESLDSDSIPAFNEWMEEQDGSVSSQTN